MKNFFKKIGKWFKDHKPSKRRLIQLYTALLYNANVKGFFNGTIYKGNTKKLCLPGFNCYSCPGAVAACPLGSLQSALTNSDTKWPAYVFGSLILFGLILGRTICGFFCPLGMMQELLYKVPSPKVKKSTATKVLSYLKYVILAVMILIVPFMYTGDVPVPTFCKYICPAGTFEGAVGLLATNDEYFASLGFLFSWKFTLLVLFIVACIFLFRFFCRFICPLGALYGFFCRIALLGVKVDKSKCTDCGLCISVCKMDTTRVGDHECVQCGECISVCPTKAIAWKGSSLFVKPNQLDAPAAEGKPLTAFVKPKEEKETSPAAETAATMSIVTPEVDTMKNILSAKEKERKRNKILEGVAWGLALTVLAGALVYFNFVEKDETVLQIGVGDECPDFTLTTYTNDADGSFTLSENLGKKVTLINYWYIGCGGCEAEMPHLNRISEECAGQVDVIAVHSEDTYGFDVADWLSKREDKENGGYWNEYSIIFAQDGVQSSGLNTYNTLGGNSAWPMTVIVDEEGIVQFYHTSDFKSYEDVKGVVEGILAD